MRSKFKITQLILVCALFTSLHALRPMSVAGSFYPEDKKQLSQDVKTALNSAKVQTKQEIDALIVPHAGYVFSSTVAASAYKTLNKNYKTIFIIGSSHYVNFDGASIYKKGNYKTPLGLVHVDTKLASKIIKKSPAFSFNPNAHKKEHSIEVQLPFLQTIYGNKLNIVPIIIGTKNPKTIKEIAKTLKPYFNDENLFVISTDLSHYPSFNDANKVDKKTLDSLTTNSPKNFVKAMALNEGANIDALETSACGWSSLLTLLYITQNSSYTYEILDYKNSANNAKYGDKKRVVGYGAMRVYQQYDAFYLTLQEKKELLEIANMALFQAVVNNKRLQIDETTLSPKLKQNLGAFVTLNKFEELRGCIGTFEQKKPLYQTIVDMTLAAAFADDRFLHVKPKELSYIDIEISVLSPRKKISSLDEIVIGKHGIYMKKGEKTGTYLPHVATDMKWNVEKFVGNCSKEKVGIGYDGYKNAEIFTYEAIVFD